MTTTGEPKRVIFILAGQSNMAGRGTLNPNETIPPESRNIYSFSQTTDSWEIARDPLHSDKPNKAGIGPGLPFALEVVRMYPDIERVMLVPCAWGGSAMSRWSKGGDLFDEAIRRTRLAVSSAGDEAVIAGILWHQGESDCGDLALALDHTKATIDALKEMRVGVMSAAPVIVGGLGVFLDNQNDSRFRFAKNVDDGLRTLPNEMSCCAYVSADGLNHRGDRLHFDTDSQVRLGRRYAQAWLGLQTLLPQPDNYTFEESQHCLSPDQDTSNFEQAVVD